MLLPAKLYKQIEPHFPHHHCWHLARHQGQELLRKKFDGECDRRLHGLNEEGSGCDFLKFHRRMMRHLKWLLAGTPVKHFTFEPWTGATVPAWVERALQRTYPTFDLALAYTRIDDLVKSGTLDDLGGFLEPNTLYRGQAGAGLHNRVHNAIADFEKCLYAGDETAIMSNIGRSPGNVFFWTLHGWIDEIYANWQRQHGEEVDQSPVEMPHVHISCKGEVSLLV